MGVAVSHAVISMRDGSQRTLDSRVQPDEVVTPEDAENKTLLSRLLTRILAEIATLKRSWTPRVITFRDIVSTGSSSVPYTARLPHNFGALVEFEVVDVTDPGVVSIPYLCRTSASDLNTLVLDIYYPSTLAIRVTEAG